jgi:two-component system, cell cycle response regulator DivK
MMKLAKVGSNESADQQPLVLVVDDNEDNLLLLSFVVEQLNCQIITAKDGQTTLELAQSRQPTLILLDMMLPDLDGMEVFQRLRQNLLTKEIPVIVVTAMASQQDRDRILLAGCNAYVSKPYSVDELEKLLSCYLNQDFKQN